MDTSSLDNVATNALLSAMQGAAGSVFDDTSAALNPASASYASASTSSPNPTSNYTILIVIAVVGFFIWKYA